VKNIFKALGVCPKLKYGDKFVNFKMYSEKSANLIGRNFKFVGYYGGFIRRVCI
jgi:hypothetical protein